MNPKTVLLVDDSRTILMQEQVILKRSYALLTAHDGREALKTAVVHHPDLILMDVVMPEMDGLTACRELRKDPRTKDIPIILVTTRGEHVSRRAGFESGCTEYLTKPINPVDLMARIGECLGAPALPNIRPADAARSRALREYQVVGTPPEEELDRLAALAAHVCDTPMAAITFVDREGIWVKAMAGGAGGEEMPRQGSLCARVVESSALFAVEDVSKEAAFRDHAFVRAHEIRFYAGLPLEPPDGIPLGSLCVFDRKPRKLSAACGEMLATVARQVVTQLEVRRQAIRDVPTGTFNRRYMEETLERELRRADRLGTPLGLVLLRIGAPLPSALLCEVGSLLQARTRADDLVCRYESETFLVILPSASPDNTRRRGQQLRSALEELEGVKSTVATATYPDDGRDPEALLSAAAMALRA